MKTQGPTTNISEEAIKFTKQIYQVTKTVYQKYQICSACLETIAGLRTEGVPTNNQRG